MVNIGEGKKFLTEWMDQHGFTKKDVQKRKKACEKRHVKIKEEHGQNQEKAVGEKKQKSTCSTMCFENGFEHSMKRTGQDTCWDKE